MIALLAFVAVGMGAAFLILVATIVVRRAIADRRRRREGAQRPTLEAAVAEYLGGDDPPPAPVTVADRRLLRTIALEAMGELKGRERERLVALVEDAGIVSETAAELGSRWPRRRRTAAEALRQIASEQAAATLLSGLADRDVDTRLTCAAALAELREEEPIPALVDLAEAAAVERPGAVAAILVTLGRRHPTAIGGSLEAGRRLELRRLAAAVAGELRLAEQVGALRRCLAEDDDELVARAARGLGAIGDDGAVEPLLGLVEAGDRAWFVRLAATGALGAIGDPRAVVPLEHELRDGEWSLQAKAARALRLLGATGEAALERTLESPLSTARDHARVALGR
jgi:HEAT repeat protein